jgi:hypothetical protein
LKIICITEKIPVKDHRSSKKGAQLEENIARGNHECKEKDCTSIIAMTLSLFVRSTCMTFSQVDLKLPSIPLTSIALTSMRVNLNGT